MSVARKVAGRVRASLGFGPSGWPPHLRRAARAGGMISADEADLLYRLAQGTGTGCIVEVGSFRGRSTIALALGTAAGARVPVFAVDPHETFTGVMGFGFGPQDRAAFYRNMLASGAYANVRLLNTSSEVLGPGWDRPVGLLWIDGDHTYAGVRRDYEVWRPHLAPAARVAFDDATNPSMGPYRLIEELSAEGALRELERVGKIVAFEVART